MTFELIQKPSAQLSETNVEQLFSKLLSETRLENEKIFCITTDKDQSSNSECLTKISAAQVSNVDLKVVITKVISHSATESADSKIDKSSINRLETVFQNQTFEQFQKKYVNFFMVDQNTAFVLLQEPVELFFCTSKASTAIKVSLSKQYSLTRVTSFFSVISKQQQTQEESSKVTVQYPSQLFIYGSEAQAEQNRLFSINLRTFDLKQVPQANTYSPKFSKHWKFHHFSDQRLYVFGDQQNCAQEIDAKEPNLLWSFDLQKGYWFALELQSPNISQKCERNSLEKDLETPLSHKVEPSCLYSSGKVIFVKDSSLQMLEIYQSKISQIISSQRQLFKQVRGLFKIGKQLYFYNESKVLTDHCYQIVKKK